METFTSLTKKNNKDRVCRLISPDGSTRVSRGKTNEWTKVDLLLETRFRFRLIPSPTWTEETRGFFSRRVGWLTYPRATIREKKGGRNTAP